MKLFENKYAFSCIPKGLHHAVNSAQDYLVTF